MEIFFETFYLGIFFREWRGCNRGPSSIPSMPARHIQVDIFLLIYWRRIHSKRCSSHSSFDKMKIFLLQLPTFLRISWTTDHLIKHQGFHFSTLCCNKYCHVYLRISTNILLSGGLQTQIVPRSTWYLDLRGQQLWPVSLLGNMKRPMCAILSASRYTIFPPQNRSSRTSRCWVVWRKTAF